MNTYITKPTQEQRILRRLQERGDKGLAVYEMMTPRPKGLGIAQYNARIYELRQKGYNIVNAKGRFVLRQYEPQQKEITNGR